MRHKGQRLDAFVEDKAYISQVAPTISFFLGMELPKLNERPPLYAVLRTLKTSRGGDLCTGLITLRDESSNLKPFESFWKGKGFRR